MGNTAKLTNAMQLIAASKLRRVQQAASNGKNYANKMKEILETLAAVFDENPDAHTSNDMLVTRPLNRLMLLVITPDRGLAGALVGNINRLAGQTVFRSDAPVSIVTIGQKGERFFARSGQDMLASFRVRESPSMTDTVSISRYLMNQYLSHACDRVDMVYADFISTTVQKPVKQTLIPISPAKSSEAEMAGVDYIYEPSLASALNAILPRYVDTQVYQVILSAIASEYSARMVAMKNATDSANQLVADLTLDLNKARQESITSELLDIIGGAAALTN